MSEDNYVLDILLSEDGNYMGTGFTKKQYHSLQDLFDGFHRQLQQRSPAPPAAPPAAASPPAHKPCTEAPPLLPFVTGKAYAVRLMANMLK